MHHDSSCLYHNRSCIMTALVCHNIFCIMTALVCITYDADHIYRRVYHDKLWVYHDKFCMLCDMPCMYRGSCHVSVCIVTGLMCIMTGFVCTTTGLVTGPCIMTGPMCVMISLVCIVTGLMCIKDMDEEALRSADMPFSTPSAAGHECHLSTCKYRRITPDNRGEYIRLALSYRYTQLQTAGSRTYPRPQL